MNIKPEKFLCAFNAQGWGRFNADKLEDFAKRHLALFKPQDSQKIFCEDCQQMSEHIFHGFQLVDWKKGEYNPDFAKTFHLDIDDVDENIEELVIIQCSNCGNWRVIV